MLKTGQQTLAKIMAPGRLLVAVAVAATLVVSICTINSAGRFGEPFPGFFIWENLLIPAVGEPTWTGVSEGVGYHSWLLQVEGRPVSDAAGFNAEFATRESDKAIGYLLKKDGAVYEVEVEPMVLGPRAWAAVLGIYIFDGIALLLLGIVVLYMNPKDRAARALFLFCADLGLYIATSTDIFGPYWFRIPYFYFINLFPAATLYLLSHFPVGRVRKPYEGPAISIVGVLGIVQATVANAVFHTNKSAVILLEAVSYTMLAVVGVVAIAFFTWHFVRTRSTAVRDRLKVVLFGVVGAFVLPVVMLVVVYVGGVAFPLNFLTVVFVLFPVSIGYAIAKHDLFGIDRVIKRTLVYATLSAFILGTYMAGITLLDSILESNIVVSRLAQAVLVLVLILITTPSRLRIQDFVDRVYDRRRYNYRDVVKATSKTFSTILDFGELIRTVLRLIDETLQPTAARIHTVDDGDRAILRGRLHHEVSGSDSPVLDLHSREQPEFSVVVDALGGVDYLQVDDDPSAARRPSRIQAAMSTLEIALAVPMRLEGKSVGVISVGSPRAGGRHSAEDVELLQTVCDQLAVALENARAYGKIDSLARGLEEKNVALEQANEELTETRDELVRQERLAAVGQLAAAVAHAIRNPLAGIKAAAQLAVLESEDSEDIDRDDSTLHDIISETDRLNDRISALLEFSRPFEPHLRAGSLNHTVASAVRATAGKASLRGITMDVRLDESLPEIEIDDAFFEQVGVELLANAIDASPDGSSVVVRTGRVADRGSAAVWFEVEDSGKGVPADKQGRIFDLFFTTKSMGTGFGLATVKKIVERHGGTVSVDNVGSGGACFRVILPGAGSNSG